MYNYLLFIIVVVGNKKITTARNRLDYVRINSQKENLNKLVDSAQYKFDNLQESQFMLLCFF